jgi:hypothetical protein
MIEFKKKAILAFYIIISLINFNKAQVVTRYNNG